jgi:hypothetical protein
MLQVNHKGGLAGSHYNQAIPNLCLPNMGTKTPFGTCLTYAENEGTAIVKTHIIQLS